MRAISLQEPWATYIFHDDKRVENRTWKTDYIGRIVICTSRKMDKSVPAPSRRMFPFGYAVGVVDIIGYDREMKTAWDAEGQWHWRLANPREFLQPFIVHGRLGIYQVSDEEVRAARYV